MDVGMGYGSPGDTRGTTESPEHGSVPDSLSLWNMMAGTPDWEIAS